MAIFIWCELLLQASGACCWQIRIVSADLLRILSIFSTYPLSAGLCADASPLLSMREQARICLVVPPAFMLRKSLEHVGHSAGLIACSSGASPSSPSSYVLFSDAVVTCQSLVSRVVTCHHSALVFHLFQSQRKAGSDWMCRSCSSEGVIIQDLTRRNVTPIGSCVSLHEWGSGRGDNGDKAGV